MFEMMLIGFAAIAIMLVGHGMWVLVSWTLQGLAGTKRKAPPEPTLDDDRIAAARYFRHLRARGQVDDETVARWMGLLARDESAGTGDHAATPQEPAAPDGDAQRPPLSRQSPQSWGPPTSRRSNRRIRAADNAAKRRRKDQA